MNNSSFFRKIIYIVIIACLLIPLSLVARPASVDSKSGGQLADLREEHELSQGQMTEIDPASETMKLASLGLRGVAVNLLWMQAIEHKKKHNWDQLESTLNALVKIQPNFIKVWEYQAHNMSYNISMEFDDYEYRYRWVRKGISFLTKGLKPNYRDHRMTDNLGQFTGLKLGVADEKRQFRRIFRTDTEFHDEMAQFGIEKEDYNLGAPYLHDNWLLAYQWYDKSRNKVEEKSYRQMSSDMMFYMKRPSQLRSSAAAIGKEFRTDEAIQLLWGRAHEEWLEYGDVPLGNTLGQIVSLEDLARIEETLERKRKQLDKLAPKGVREEIETEIEEKLAFTEEELAVLSIPDDQRDDEQDLIAKKAIFRQNSEMAAVDQMVFEKIPQDEKFKGRKILEEISALLTDMRTIDKYRGTINYRYWRIRTRAEKDEITILARQLMDDAQELQRQSIFDDEYELDPKTGERRVTKKGALTTYEECYEKFAIVMQRYPRLMDGDLADEILDSLVVYKDMLTIAGLDWPEDFSLQELVDIEMSSRSSTRGLPSTESMRQAKIESGEIDPDAEETEEETEGQGGEDQMDDPEDADEPESTEPKEAELPAEEDAEDADAEPKEAELPAEEDAEVAPEAE